MCFFWLVWGHGFYRDCVISWDFGRPQSDNLTSFGHCTISDFLDLSLVTVLLYGGCATWILSFWNAPFPCWNRGFMCFFMSICICICICICTVHTHIYIYIYIYNQQRVIFGYIVPLSRFCEAKIFQKVACVWCWHHCSRCNSATHPFSGCFCRCSFHQSLRMLGFWALCLKRRIHQPEIHPKYDHFRWSLYFRQNLAHWWDDSQWTVRNPSSLHLPYQNQPKSSN